MTSDTNYFIKTIDCASDSRDSLTCTIMSTNEMIIRVSEDHRLASVVLDLEKTQELIDFLTKAKKELSQ